MDKNTVINCKINYCNKLTNCISNKNSIITISKNKNVKKNENRLISMRYNNKNNKSFVKNIK